jgi:hypothetical protein
LSGIDGSFEIDVSVIASHFDELSDSDLDFSAKKKMALSHHEKLYFSKNPIPEIGKRRKDRFSGFVVSNVSQKFPKISALPKAEIQGREAYRAERNSAG